MLERSSWERGGARGSFAVIFSITMHVDYLSLKLNAQHAATGGTHRKKTGAVIQRPGAGWISASDGVD